MRVEALHLWLTSTFGLDAKRRSKMASIVSLATVADTVVTSRASPQPMIPSIGINPAMPSFTRKTNKDFASLPSNGSRLKMIKVWPSIGLKFFETLSYVPPLTDEQLAKEVDCLLRQGWIPCLEFENEVTRVLMDATWTMWKLPMFGCTDSAQVLAELEEAKKKYPNAYIRIIGFDDKRQVQCISFIAYKPPGSP